MSDVIRMNVFDSVDNSVAAEDVLPDISKNATPQQMLDYMVLVLSRVMSCDMAFKGGYMLNQLLGSNSRMTRDIDFSISDEKNYEDIKSILKRIADKFIERSLISSYNVKETIAPKCSGGIDFYDSAGVKILGVDVGLHDISYGITHYKLSFTDVEAFTVERMLADKLIAITTRKRFRRTKDLYDFYVITNFFDVNLEFLNDFIDKRGGAEWDNIPFNDDVIAQYQHAWDKLDLHSFGGEGYIQKPDFITVLNRFYSIALRLKDGNTSYMWESLNARAIHL